MLLFLQLASVSIEFWARAETWIQCYHTWCGRRKATWVHPVPTWRTLHKIQQGFIPFGITHPELQCLELGKLVQFLILDFVGGVQVFYDSSHSLPRSSWVRFWLWFFVKCPFFLSRRQNPSKYTPHTFLVRLIHNLHPLVDPPIHTGSSLSCPHDKYHIPLPQSWTWRGLQAS